jgi:hypothetical protein
LSCRGWWGESSFLQKVVSKSLRKTIHGLKLTKGLFSDLRGTFQRESTFTSFLFFFFFFCSTGVCTPGLALARQMLYHLNHSPTLFHLVTLELEYCVFAQASLDHNPTYASCVVGMTSVYFHVWILLLLLRWGLTYFLPRCKPQQCGKGSVGQRGE